MTAPALATSAERGERLCSLMRQFNLTTAAEEIVPRLVEHDLSDAVPVLTEVLEAEAGSWRRGRRARTLGSIRGIPREPGERKSHEEHDRRRRRPPRAAAPYRPAPGKGQP